MEDQKDISKQGYKDDSPYKDRPYLDIHTPNGVIDMTGVSIPLLANNVILGPNSGLHKFNTRRVREIPMAQRGREQGVIKPYVPSNYFPSIGGNPNFLQSGDKGSLMPLKINWEGKWQNDLGMYRTQNYMVPGLDVETGEWGDKPYTTNFMNEWDRSGLEPTFTFTSAGGPGAGFRGYFPYSDPLGIGLEVDLDPTGPGGGILVNTGNLRKWSNNLADRIGDNSVGNSFRDLNLPPGFLYSGVEVAGNVPAPFVGATVSLNDTENLEKWLQLPENQGKSNFSRGFMHALGPGLHAWNKGPKLSGQMTINNPLNPMGNPLWKSPDFFGGKKIHNPLSGTGVGIGGRTGLKGGNIIPHIEIGAFEQGVRGGFASIKEEVTELAEDMMKKNKKLTQSAAMKKAYSETAGNIPTGKLFNKLKIPQLLDAAGELIYGAPGSGVTAPYQKSGNTLANYLKNSKIPYGKFINNPWFWKTIARGLMVPDIINTVTGAMHQKNQPIADAWEGAFGEDRRNVHMEKYGTFPRMQRWWNEGIDPILGAKWWKSDAEEHDDNMTMMNELYEKAFIKKYNVTKEQIKAKELELQEKNNWENATDLELLKEAEKNSPAEVAKAEKIIREQKAKESSIKSAKMHSENPYLGPKYKHGGSVKQSPYDKEKFALKNQDGIIADMMRNGAFLPKFKMGSEKKIETPQGNYTIKKDFDKGRNLPYVNYKHKDIDDRVYYDKDDADGSGNFQIIDIAQQIHDQQRAHDLTKKLIKKYRNGDKLSPSGLKHLSALGMIPNEEVTDPNVEALTTPPLSIPEITFEDLDVNTNVKNVTLGDDKVIPIDDQIALYMAHVSGAAEGTPYQKKLKRIYDKLNRVYYQDSKKAGLDTVEYMKSLTKS
jgi:hypothetical protein